jgi:hypothetical protein
MLVAAAWRFCPWVLVSTVRPTTTRRSLRGIPPGTPTNSTQWAAVRTSNGEIRLPPQYWRSQSLVPNDWASRAAWNLYFPLGTAVPPTILGVIAPGARDRPFGPALMGSRLAAARAAGPPASASIRAIGASRLPACPTPSSFRSPRTGSRPRS